MRGRLEESLTDRARIVGLDPADVDEEDVDTNAIGETLVDVDDDDDELAVDVPCAFESESTSFVREATGERVRRPATATFLPDAPLREGRLVTFDVDDHATEYEVLGLEETRDHRRGEHVSVEAELGRAD